MISVSLVIPGRNCGATIGVCLDAVVPMLDDGTLGLIEIIVVDDGSTDDTATIVGQYDRVIRLTGTGRGPGAARNLGWQQAKGELIWFIDSDCVADPDALRPLLDHLIDDESPDVAGVSGSYGIMNPQHLLACLIHEEIIERHRRMPQRTTFVATFNVLYRRHVLERVGGFDERYRKAQDAELGFRLAEAGAILHFEFTSRVRHFHPTRLVAYLRTQCQHGYWRVLLHRRHRGHAIAGSYSNWVDHLQPPLGVAALAAIPLAFTPMRWIPLAALVLLAVLQIPMTARIVLRCRHPKYLLFAPLSFVRAFARGLGMVVGVVRPRPDVR